MAYALVDNATLTAVQRLLGRAVVRSRDAVHGDCVALENLIQSILFYDEVVCIDNYKEEYKQARKKEFPFIRFLNPKDFSLDKIESLAQKEAGKFRPVIRGGEFADEDFANFLNLLKMHIICTWDIRSSIYYLTMKMLGRPDTDEFQKYGKLSAAIFNELLDRGETQGPRCNSVVLIDSQGNPIIGGYKVPGARWGNGEIGGMTEALSAFVASLNWVTYKTIYYCLSAGYLRADVFLYPIRQAFQLHYMQKTNTYDVDFTAALIKKMSGEINDDLGKIISATRSNSICLDLPLFSAWLVLKVGDVKQILQTALEIRDDPHITEARGQLKEIRNALEENDIGRANTKAKKVLNDLSKVSKELRVKFGVEIPQGFPILRLVQAYNTLAAFTGLPQLPELQVRIPLPKFMNSVSKAHGFSSLYRDIGRDLASIERLGQIRDKLGAAVNLEYAGNRAYHPKAEDPRYRYAHSKWKSPM